MGDTTISWVARPGTRARSWNPTQGCEMVSPGCKNCYAMRLAARFAIDGWSQGLINLRTKKWSAEGRVAVHKLAEPLTWRQPSTVFVNSMSDLFWDKFTDQEIATVFGVMAACPQHVFIIATKRARRMRDWFRWADEHGNGYDRLRFGPSALLTCAWEASTGDVWGDDDDGRQNPQLLDIPSANTYGTRWPLPNVWLLVSVENQDMADERISHLLHTPAAVRGISAEPLLDDIDLNNVKDYSGLFTIDALNEPPRGSAARLQWVIAGCESGPGARKVKTHAFRALRDQCRRARVPFFFKQGDVKMEGITAQTSIDVKPGGVAEPALLDGVLHQEWPA